MAAPTHHAANKFTSVRPFRAAAQLRPRAASRVCASNDSNYLDLLNSGLKKSGQTTNAQRNEINALERSAPRAELEASTRQDELSRLEEELALAEAELNEKEALLQQLLVTRMQSAESRLSAETAESRAQRAARAAALAQDEAIDSVALAQSWWAPGAEKGTVAYWSAQKESAVAKSTLASMSWVAAERAAAEAAAQWVDADLSAQQEALLEARGRLLAERLALAPPAAEPEPARSLASFALTLAAPSALATVPRDGEEESRDGQGSEGAKRGFFEVLKEAVVVVATGVASRVASTVRGRGDGDAEGAPLTAAERAREALLHQDS